MLNTLALKCAEGVRNKRSHKTADHRGGLEQYAGHTLSLKASLLIVSCIYTMH